MLRTFTAGFCLALCLLLFALFSPWAHAVKNGEDEPIRINAKSVEASEKTGVAVYTGNVLVEQGGLSIRADRLEIRMRDGKTDLIRATGKPAKLRQQPDRETEEVQAEAGRIDYRVPDKKIEMTGNVTLHRGDDLFTGAVLHYDLAAKVLTAAGDEKSNGRIHVVIQPRKPSTTPPPP